MMAYGTSGGTKDCSPKYVVIADYPPFFICPQCGKLVKRGEVHDCNSKGYVITSPAPTTTVSASSPPTTVSASVAVCPMYHGTGLVRKQG